MFSGKELEMSGNKDINRSRASYEVGLFRKDGLVPIIWVLKYLDKKHNNVYINIDKRSVVLKTH